MNPKSPFIKQQRINKTTLTQHQKWPSKQRRDPSARLRASFKYTYNQLLALPRQMRRRLQRKFGLSLVRVALALTLSGTPIASIIRAEPVHVPTAGITVNGTTCTLEEAITSANNDNAASNGCVDGSGADIITLAADVTLAAALPAITTEITIEGKGHFIDGADSFRVLEVSSASGDLTLNNATIQNGNANSGAGILVGSGATLAVNNTIAITNSGPSTATNALISDLLPTDITFAPGSISASGINTGTVGSSPATLASGVTLLPNQKIELSFAATVNQNVLANQTITNTVQLTSTEVITPAQALNLIKLIAPTVSISDVTVSEADGRATFRVALERASAIPVMVDFTTVAGSATEEDYTPINGTLTIAAGESQGVITVQITDDDLTEEEESFTIQLSNPTNVTISDGQAIATISDNDEVPTALTIKAIDTQSPAKHLAGVLFALLIISGLLFRIRKS